MTSVNTQAHLIHDSGGWFDNHTSCRHTHIKNYLVNDNITVERMPFTTTGDDDSTYMEEYGGNATERNVRIEISMKSEEDFDSLVSEMSFENGGDARDSTNEAFDYSESECYENDRATICETDEIEYQSDPTGYDAVAIDIPYNSDIGGNRPDQNSNVSSHCIKNNIKNFPKYKKILNSCLPVKECYNSEIVTNSGNIHLSREDKQRNVVMNSHQDALDANGDKVHVNDDDFNSGQFTAEKETDNSWESNNAHYYLSCSSIGDNTYTRDSGLHTCDEKKAGHMHITELSIKNNIEPSIENEHIEDEDNTMSLKEDARLRNMYTYNWTQGLPQSELFQTEVAISDVTNLHEECNNSADETAVEGSGLSGSSSPNTMESECFFSPVDEMRHDMRKFSCCSISSISSLSIAEFLLGPYSKSSTPNISLPQTRQASIEEMEELSHSRRSSLSYAVYSRRSSLTNASCGVLPNFSRRSSQSSVGPSRPTSPFLEEHSLSAVTEISSKASTLSQISSMSVDSEPAFLLKKSSIVDRRISDASEISSISLSGIFGERESMFTSPFDQMDDKERNDRPSPSPFGDQLKYFQDKKKKEMFLVKATTARLGLNTRRKSYSLWRKENLDNKGKPLLMKPEINVGQKTDVFTKERVTAINMAIDWVREELHQLREQDESLAHQLLDIRRTIHELKLDWSCENHREMLMEAEDEIKENRNLKRVSDLPEHHTLDCILRDKGMTRIKRGDRKYSIF
ncbi:uncharacterized protein LOC117316583 isoform X2 [Pecten maximus]|nr:uncharacterized protein LOC117316583 isoform X2 [Pecten maximus]